MLSTLQENEIESVSQVASFIPVLTKKKQLAIDYQAKQCQTRPKQFSSELQEQDYGPLLSFLKAWCAPPNDRSGGWIKVRIDCCVADECPTIWAVKRHQRSNSHGGFFNPLSSREISVRKIVNLHKSHHKVKRFVAVMVPARQRIFGNLKGRKMNHQTLKK